MAWDAANGGVTNGGLRGVWPPFLGIGPFRPFSPFFCLFCPFPEGAKSTWEIQKTEEKGLFPQISSDLLKPPSLKPPFAALQMAPNPSFYTFLGHFSHFTVFFPTSGGGQNLYFSMVHREVPNGVGVDGVGVIFPFLTHFSPFSTHFPLFLHAFSPFFFAFLCFS